MIRNSEDGVATLEILIAMTIIILAVSAVIVVVFSGQSFSVDSQTDQDALYKNQTLLETARANASKSVSLVSSQTISDPFYSGNLSASDLNVDVSKLVSTALNWHTDVRTQAMASETIVVDLKAALGSSGCSNTVSSGWSNPTILNPSHTIDIDPDTLTGMTYANNVVYITGNHSSASKDDFYTVDASDPTWPKLYPNGHLNTGPGLAAVVVAGHYAYVANTSTTAQLQVIDVTDPANPVYLSSANRQVASTHSSVGNSIYYYKNTVYLGLTAHGSEPQFAIFDVTTPTNPIAKGTYNQIGHDVNSIRVKDDYAYVASPANENMTILNISNPNSPTRVGGFTPTALPDSNGVGSNYGESLFVTGNTAYLGRTYGTNEFYVLNVSTPGNVSVSNSADFGSGNQTSINGVIVRSNLVFTTTNSVFQVRQLSNLSSVFGSLTLSSTSPTGDFNCNGNVLYVGVLGPSGTSGHDVLKIIGPGAGP